MSEACAYRGPDGIRYWVEGPAGLSHLALHSTPQAAGELQPLPGAGGRVVLVADARVDNRGELSAQLGAKGFLDQPDPSDAELILAAYLCWGPDCPAHILGDFAFAIWDAPEQRLFCARDALGVKTLYYGLYGAGLCVASEAQQILRHPLIPCRLDEVAVADFLLRHRGGEERTFFEGIRGLPPAHFLLAGQDGLRLGRYWDVDPTARTFHANDAGYAEQFLDIFQRAVSDRLRTCGSTIGITMSGGMDSTSIAAVAQPMLDRGGGSPHLLACSYAFDRLSECDECRYSRAMAEELGVDLRYIPAEDFWLLDDDTAYMPSLETPFMADVSITRHILGLFQQQGARVWLTGHGGDSVLAGSSLVCADRLQRGDLGVLVDLARTWRGTGLPLSRLLRAGWNWGLRPLLSPLAQVWRRSRREKPDLPVWLDPDFARRTQIAERLAEREPARFTPDRAWRANYQSAVNLAPILPSLHWIERTAAAFHLEPRHPFLDRRLVEYVLSIPGEQLFRNGGQKYILREACKGILPERIRTRWDKTIFNRSLAMGLREMEVPKITTLLQSPQICEKKIILREGIQGAYRRFVEQGPDRDSATFWRVISLEVWLSSQLLPFSQGVPNEQESTSSPMHRDG